MTPHTLFITVIARYIKARRFESFSLHTLLQNFKINACTWVIAQRSSSQATPQEAELRKELLAEFLHWLIESWLTSLLGVRAWWFALICCLTIEYLVQTTFYVSESAAYKNRLLYFRMDDWRSVCDPLLKEVSASLFEPISSVRL